MRVLLATHATTVGGTQLACRLISQALAGQGHDVLVVGPPGPLADEYGVDFVDGGWVHRPGRRPSLGVARALGATARSYRADVVHTFGGVAIAREALVGAQMVAGIPIVATDYGLPGRTRYPSRVPLVIGRSSFASKLSSSRPGPVAVVPPPIDVEADDPGAFGSAPHDVSLPDGPLIAMVSRLEEHQKGPGIRAAIQAMQHLDGQATLVVVGDGSSRMDFEELASHVNTRAGRVAVAFTGELSDPRAVYDRAEVILGLGTSALRGMAFAKPVVVLGEDGSAETVDESNMGRFQADGFFATQADTTLDAQVRALLGDPARRADLGSRGRRFVVENRSPASAAATLEAFYAGVVATRSIRRAAVRDLAGAVRSAVTRRSVLRRDL